ncbi:MAG: gliding motility-associated C-terminal domain-containing protein [Flavobacteriales bacterium]|nr:gliding motility-associated C-terminal domain-containing protein [Flavobacteriales bacterium]
MRYWICIVVLVVLSAMNTQAQFQCGSNTPTFIVDLSGDPNSSWSSPDTNRADTCCGASSPDKCVGFEVTLNPNAEGIIFEICDGAIPPGAIYYQVDCGSPTAVGEALCLTGVGPHYITFCKPGNNSNIYCITSIAEPAPGPDISVNDGCSGYMYVEGYDPDSVTWTSVYPGAIGAYNSYLDCTSGCDSVNVMGQANAPDTVLYQVCGPLLGDCDTLSYCDTIAAYFFSTLAAVISPEEPMVCYGAAGTWIYASGTGGSPPYNYTWNTGSTADSIFVGVGTYTLEVGDTSGCPPAYDTVFVDSFSLPIVANAGNDTTVCSSFWPITLNGSVQSASGGYWIGGDGTFSPDSATLNAQYQPGINDSTSGSVELYLITTGNLGCPPDTDTVLITLHVYSSAVEFGTLSVLCAGENNGSAWVQFAPGTSQLVFEWLTTPPQIGDSITGLGAGTYQVIISDPFGCDSLSTITVIEPDTLEMSLVSLDDASCGGYTDGAIEVSSAGGVIPYSYTWNTGDTTAAITGLGAGSYLVTVTDSNGCEDTLNFTVTEPPGINIAMTGVDVDCFGDNTGAATAAATGPYGSFAYNWNTGSGAPIIFNLTAGTYIVTVTYGAGCLDSDTVIITQPDSLELYLAPIDITCYGAQNGSISSSVIGGVIPYGYAWSTTETTVQIAGLAAGTYTLTVTDDNACEVIVDATIVEPDSLETTESILNVSCFGFADGSISSTPSGGTSPYTYNWNTSATTSSITNLSAGTYSLVVTDSNNCTDTSVYTIVEPLLLQVSLSAQDITCNGGSDGTIGTAVSGGTAPYSYNWSSGGTASSDIGLSAGLHSVTVTDFNGCELILDTTLTEPTPIQVQMSNNVTICLYDNAVIFAAASGGNGGYSYTWSDSLGNNDSHVVDPLVTTTYSVSVTDTFGCPAAIGTVKVTVKPVVFDAITVSSDPIQICLGKSAKVTGQYGGSLSEYSVTWAPNLGSNVGSYTVSPEVTSTYVMRVTDACGFYEEDSVTVVVNPVPILDFPDLIADGCAPLEVTFNSGISGISIAEYKWKFGNGQSSTKAIPTMIYFNPGTYDVEFSAMTDQGCPSEGDGTGQVEVYPSPAAGFYVTPDKVTTDDPLVETVDESEDAVTYDWEVSDGATYDGSSISHRFQEWGEYSITQIVQNMFGCVDTSIQYVYVEPVLVLEAPTAFTPNRFDQSDASYDPSAMNNDVFYLITRYVKIFHLVIYNRWGETVFETFDASKGWNGYYKGELAPMSTYVWRADIVFVDDHEATKTGHVTLLR